MKEIEDSLKNYNPNIACAEVLIKKMNDLFKE